MKDSKKLVILGVLAIMIVIVLGASVTYAFMAPQISSGSVTSVNLTTCAKIKLEGASSINLENSYPMSKNVALKNTPYTFTVSSSCEGNVGFNLYLATLNTNTLSANDIRYIITNTGTKTIVNEGILGSVSDVLSSFTDAEVTEYNAGVKGTVSNIYKLYNEDLPLKGSATYDLYLYIDEAATGGSEVQSFAAGLAVKAYDIG